MGNKSRIIDLEKLKIIKYDIVLIKCVLPYSSLPHGLRTESGDVCLFTRDEPRMTSEQTVRFYKKLLAERGVKNAIEVFHLSNYYKFTRFICTSANPFLLSLVLVKG